MRPIERCVFYTSFFKTNILLCLDFSYLALVTVATAEAEKLGCSYVILTSEGPVCGGWGGWVKKPAPLVIGRLLLGTELKIKIY